MIPYEKSREHHPSSSAAKGEKIHAATGLFELEFNLGGWSRGP